MSSLGARLGGILGLLLLPSCDLQAIGAGADDTLPPAGVPDIEDAVDGLTVGHRLMAAGEYELALKSYTRAINTQGLNGDVLSAMGSANLKLGRLQQAETFLEQATELDPDFVAAWNNLGVVQTSLKNYPAAHQSFRAAFSLDNGKSEEIWQNLLLAINNLKNNEAVQADPTNFDLVRRGNGRYLLLETPQSRG